MDIVLLKIIRHDSKTCLIFPHLIKMLTAEINKINLLSLAFTNPIFLQTYGKIKVMNIYVHITSQCRVEIIASLKKSRKCLI